jgi:hypothetical protein
MTEEIMAEKVSDRRPETLSKNQGILVLDAFKNHATKKA